MKLIYTSPEDKDGLLGKTENFVGGISRLDLMAMG
jgi:hypothetical protein